MKNKNDLSREYPKYIQNEWQELLEVIAETLNIPCSLIMKKHDNQLEIYLTNTHPDNPYKQNHFEDLAHEPYCNAAMSEKDYLLIPDATEDPKWENSPDVALGMISYLGLPLKDPSGNIFGTICVLDNKKNTYSETFINLLRTIKSLIEMDMKRIFIHRKILNQKNEKIKNKEIALQEVISSATKIHEDFQRKVAINIEKTIIPILNSMDQRCPHKARHCKSYINLLEIFLKDIGSDFNEKLINSKAQLTVTELRICNLIRHGLLHKDVASLINISENTVKNHVRNIKNKLEISDERISLKEYFNRGDK